LVSTTDFFQKHEINKNKTFLIPILNDSVLTFLSKVLNNF